MDGQREFDWEQEEQLERVTARIGRAILAFCADKLGQTFHMEELRSYINAESIIAPASADRILRSLRQKKYLDYKVVNRRASLYLITLVRQ